MAQSNLYLLSAHAIDSDGEEYIARLTFTSGKKAFKAAERWAADPRKTSVSVESSNGMKEYFADTN